MSRDEYTSSYVLRKVSGGVKSGNDYYNVQWSLLGW